MSHASYHHKQIINLFSARDIFLWYFLEYSELNQAKEKTVKYLKKLNMFSLSEKQVTYVKILISSESFNQT